MADKAIIIKVIEATGSESTVKVVPSSDGGPLRLQAQVGNKYIVMDETTKFAPKDINVQKSGQDLVLSFTDSENPDVIIEQYYNVKQGRDSALFGQHENGQYYPFVPTSGQESETIYMLPEHTLVSQALGGDPVNIVASSVLIDSDVATTSISPSLLSSLYVAGAGLLAGAVGGYLASNKNKSTDDTNKLKDELNNKIDELKDKIEEQGGVTDELDRLRDKLYELDELKAKLAELKDKITELEKKIDNLPPPDDDSNPTKIDNSYEVDIDPISKIFDLKENSKDEIVFKLLPGHEDENFGGFNGFYINGFHVGKFNKDPDADRIVLKDLIIGDITPNSNISELEKYFHVTGNPRWTYLQIDSDGDGSKYTIDSYNISIRGAISLEELMGNGQLVWM